jgi:hypothetical protein
MAHDLVIRGGRSSTVPGARTTGDVRRDDGIG